MIQSLTRRNSLALIASGVALSGSAARAASSPDPFDGASLYREVVQYDALGEHRVAGKGDNATTIWLSRKLKAAGFAVERQAFPYPLFEPMNSTLAIGPARFDTFPAWPPVPTPEGGITAPLVDGATADVAGKIVLFDHPYGPGPNWTARGIGAHVAAALDRGALAAVVLTEGPTGGIIALNAEPGRFDWKKPVLMAAGKDKAALSAAASASQTVRLTNTGRLHAASHADNVIGRRPGRGRTIVVTTPKSGWFHCAGERGTGIALFLAAARWLARETSDDLLFACSSGHEINFLGSDYFLKAYAPPPDKVKYWLHIGANAAVQATSTEAGLKFLGTPGPGQLTVSEALVPAAADAFRGLPGFEKPAVFSSKTAVGELEIFQRGGYTNFIGMLGAWPLFHARDDRAAVATTPAAIAAVGRAVESFLRGQNT